jgi:signal peptidase II
MPTRPIRLIVILIVLTCTAGCDHITKHFARTELVRTGPVTLPGNFIQFILAENPGAFLSLGASLSSPIRTALAVCATIGLTFLLAYLVSTPRLQWVFFLGLAFIWAGGMSNFIDRFVRHGLVTDFILVRVGPLQTGIFNLADLAITLGLLLTLLGSVRPSPSKSEIH